MRLIIDNREPNDMITLLKERIDNVDSKSNVNRLNLGGHINKYNIHVENFNSHISNYKKDF